ncbi:MAG: 2Fe-2S iron-sulfur cluster-binding protein [Rhodovulum sp.]|jgi:aerobic-type carbon monoxide dehydrogenase small subunit (CoxS/CutS family)|nr:ferredoxin [Rhodovulum sp.]MCI5086007.1 2Fe-2S iron-sulfur cluster-binding protein [Rhodovulum sp.]|tara:strand:- start:4967 stop:5488 length:522 start_codon:yes stop_codon:yes gene_type:complete
MTISFTINGASYTVDDDQAEDRLIDYLHVDKGLTGTKLCCGIGVCRACTVAMKRPGSPVETPIIACSTALGTLNNCDIRTVEGVAENGQLSALQEKFLTEFSFQCGYCTPGFVMAATMMLDGLDPTTTTVDDLPDLINNAVGDHICRCTGYVRYYNAIYQVASDALSAAQGGQ